MAQTESGAARARISGFSRMTRPTAVARHASKTPSGFIMQDPDGYDYYFWVDTSGQLRTTDAETAEAASFNWNTGGTKVGAQ